MFLPIPALLLVWPFPVGLPIPILPIMLLLQPLPERLHQHLTQHGIALLRLTILKFRLSSQSVNRSLVVVLLLPLPLHNMQKVAHGFKRLLDALRLLRQRIHISQVKVSLHLRRPARILSVRNIYSQLMEHSRFPLVLPVLCSKVVVVVVVVAVALDIQMRIALVVAVAVALHELQSLLH
jgi:hypothetical protein